MNPEQMLALLRSALAENVLVQHLAIASLELAVLALAVVLLVRLGRIRSPRLICWLWLVVLIKPIVSLALGSPLTVGLMDHGQPPLEEAALPPALALDPTPDGPECGWASPSPAATDERMVPDTPTQPAAAPLPPATADEPATTESFVPAAGLGFGAWWAVSDSFAPFARRASPAGAGMPS